MRSPQVGSKAYALAMFGVVSVLAGLLVAGLLVPVAALGGSAAKTAATTLENLPAEFDTPPQSEKTVILMANGQQLAELFDENRVVVPLPYIAPIMQKAQIAIEDHRFYEHGAIDLIGTLRALVRTGGGSSVQGGSTLTQQYVKQVQIEAAAAKGDQAGVAKAQERTLERKIQELRYAVALETRLTKDEILERYLNIAYYGDGAYGVESAARHYFSTTSNQLTLAQAAMIAGIVQNPTANDPVNHPAAAITRRNVVINRMLELGLVTQDEADAAKKEGFDASKVQRSQKGCIGTKYPFMCDFVLRTLLDNPALGNTPEERRDVVYRGGLVVKTQIDPTMMDVAQNEVSKRIAPTDPVISTMTMIQPGTGLILAMAQNRPAMGSNEDAGQTYYNYAVERRMGGAEGYQAGSTFKAFTVAAALDRGIPPTKTFDATSPMEFRGKSFLTCENGQDVSFKFNQDYKVSNSTISGQQMTMYTGTAMSVNTYFIQLEQIAGICQAARMADTVGAKLSNGKTMEGEYSWIPSFTLGVAEVTPISMAVAYATFAARGVRCDPIIVQSINSRDGQSIATQSANCRQVIRPEVADGVNNVLQKVMTDGTGRRVRLPDGRPEAGKTGTIDSNAAVWFAGYTPNLAGVAMIAIDKAPRFKSYWDAHGGSLKNLKLPGGMYLEGSGSGDAGDIWTPTMATALKDLPASDFTDPPAEILQGKKAVLPDLRGKSTSEIQSILEGMGYTVVKRNVYDDSQPGKYLGVQCEGFVGGTCYLNFSQGPRPPDEPGSQPS